MAELKCSGEALAAAYNAWNKAAQVPRLQGKQDDRYGEARDAFLALEDSATDQHWLEALKLSTPQGELTPLSQIAINQAVKQDRVELFKSIWAPIRDEKVKRYSTEPETFALTDFHTRLGIAMSRDWYGYPFLCELSDAVRSGACQTIKVILATKPLPDVCTLNSIVRVALHRSTGIPTSVLQLLYETKQSAPLMYRTPVTIGLVTEEERAAYLDYTGNVTQVWNAVPKLPADKNVAFASDGSWKVVEE